MSERPLWAPWRIDYITGPKPAECIFCEAASSERDEQFVIARGERCFMMLNRFPYAPGHVMVAPNRHVGELGELADEEMTEIMRLARDGVGALARAMTPAGFNLGLNLGAVAGAGIAEHLHLHVVPRWSGDTNFMPILGDTSVIPQALEATRDVLVAALRPGRSRRPGPQRPRA
jgi:ATP adenylyltransferase